MRIRLRFIVVALVLAEIATFVLVGQAIGVLGTLGLTMLSTFAGILLLRQQGLATLTRMRAEMQAGRRPAGGLGEAALLALAAVLMVVPGLLSSAAGLLLFVPPLRRAMSRGIGATLRSRMVRQEPFRPAQAHLELHEGDYHTTARDDTPWRPPDAGASR